MCSTHVLVDIDGRIVFVSMRVYWSRGKIATLCCKHIHGGWVMLGVLGPTKTNPFFMNLFFFSFCFLQLFNCI